MTTQRRLRYTSAAGALAIYDVTVGSENDTPLTSPLSDLSRLHFHTGLTYPATIATYTGTINCAAVTNQSGATTTTVIAAHGRAGIPYVEGKISIAGNWVPFAGSVPVDQQSGSPSSRRSFARFLHLGADATNIVITDYSLTHSAAPGFSATSFSYVIYLTDMLVG